MTGRAATRTTSARIGRRLLGRLGGGRRRRARAAFARLRHQRLDPRAGPLCGIFGLKPTYGRLAARRQLPLRRRASTISARSPARGRRGRGLGRHPGLRSRRPGLQPTGRPRRRMPRWPRHRRPPRRGGGRVLRRKGRRGARGGVDRRARPRRERPRDPPGAARPRRRERHHRRRGRPAPLADLRDAAAGFDPRHARRFLAGASCRPRWVTAQRFRRGIAAGCRSVPGGRRRPGPGDALPRPELGQESIGSAARCCRCARFSASTPSRSPSSVCRSWRCRCRADGQLPIGVQLIAAPGPRGHPVPCRRCARAVRRGPPPEPSFGGGPPRCRRSTCPRPWPRYRRVRALRAGSGGNDVAVLTSCSGKSPHTIRYGVAENLKGWRGDRRFPAGTARGRPGTRPDRHGDHDLRPRLRHRVDRVPAQAVRTARPADADLAAHARRLARGGGACELPAGLTRATTPVRRI